MIFLLVAAGAFLAYANGANDNFKGVASLFGSSTATYRTSIWWATLTTTAGSICSMFFAVSLLTRFSGKGLVPDQFVGSEPFLLAVALGTGVTVIAATLTGFPVSTTHGLTGAILGTGLAAVGGDVNFRLLGTGFLLPLVLSPVLAVALAAPLYLGLHALRLRLGITKDWCVCVGAAPQAVAMSQPASGPPIERAVAWPVAVSTGERPQCAERYAGGFLGIGSQALIDAAHFLSAGVVSFARGLNDAPKIAALLVGIQALGVGSGLAIVAVAMAIGGLLGAKRVADTMSCKITSMNHGQGLAANLATAALVILASTQGLPVSTTHVSVGSLFGIGWAARSANPSIVAAISLAWILTLPCAALVGGFVYALIT